jgi:phosphoglycerol transferase MdoB-like AlkP superfamily enzyme
MKNFPRTAIPSGYRFLLVSLAILMLFGTVFRLLLFILNPGLALHSDPADILYAFLNRGLLFDVYIAAYILAAPFVLVSISMLANRNFRITALISNGLIIAGGILWLFVSSIDTGYFRYYNSRITSAVFTWIGEIGLTLKVMLTEFDNLLLVLLFLVITAGFVWVQLRIGKKYAGTPALKLNLAHRLAAFLAGTILLFSGIRGTFNPMDTPLLYREAFFTEDHFLNQLGFNPVYHLGYSFNDPQIDHFKEEDEFIVTALDFLERARSDDENPFLVKVRGTDTWKPNIILVFLESMSNAMVSRYNPGLMTTPFLDSLAENGMVFDRFYSAGIHTHNAIFSTLYGLPAVMNNVPMNSLATENQVFHGLPFILKEKGFVNSFYVTGSRDFDNMDRFLSLNGFDRIIADHDYPGGAIYNLWGATDETMFRKVLTDCDSLDRLGKPFFSSVLTISSHDGYIVPETIENSLKNKQYPEKLYEYADLQLRNFIAAARGKDWFDSTLFIFVGDHGQNFKPVYDLNLNYHQVPLIIYAPSSIQPMIYNSPGLQMDIYPTLCGLLDMSYINNGLGVDLLDQKRPFGYFSADNKMGVISDSMFLVYRGKANKSLYAFREEDPENRFDAGKEAAEKMLDYGFSMIQSANYLIRNKLTDLSIPMEELRNTHRYIAHAGGMIDGLPYTNSLEALDLNYRLGFRMFELDIRRASDNVFVAVHEWDEWEEITGYSGPMPPSHDVFITSRLYGKYTPLDIHRINEWFSDHPDAILVTDKINEPAEFSDKFLDRNRLMMELFTLEAVREGFRCGIMSPMPTWNVLKDIQGDKVGFLKDLGVKDVAASRRVIEKNIPLLLKLKQNGIRVYVFHVNYDKGKDEEYVIRHEMDYVYGMYADKSIF